MTLLQQGGFWVWPILLFDVLLIFLVSAALLGGVVARKHNPTTQFPFYAAILAAVLSLFPTGLGFIGWQTGLHEMEEALSHADEASQSTLRAAAEPVAKIPFQLGTKSTLIFLLPSLVIVGLKSKRPTGTPSSSA